MDLAPVFSVSNSDTEHTFQIYLQK